LIERDECQFVATGSVGCRQMQRIERLHAGRSARSAAFRDIDSSISKTVIVAGPG
jgi:hypothetical protein